VLVLSRKVDERIIITIPPSDETQVVTVMMVGTETSGAARLGIDAPKSIYVDREEVHEAIMRDGGKRKRY